MPERPVAGEILRGHADQLPEGKLAVECEQFLGGLLNSYCRKAA